MSFFIYIYDSNLFLLLISGSFVLLIIIIFNLNEKITDFIVKYLFYLNDKKDFHVIYES